MNYNDAMAPCATDQVCHICGSPLDLESYNQKEPLVKKMRHEHLCFNCAFWLDKSENPPKGREIINGSHYVFHNWNSGSGRFCGFGGRPFYALRNDGTVIRSNNVWFQGNIPDRFKDRFPNTARLITRNAYTKLKDNVLFRCDRKGCFDRYHCFFYHADEIEKNGAWNKVPANHVVGSEECELFLNKDKIFIND